MGDEYTNLPTKKKQPTLNSTRLSKEKKRKLSHIFLRQLQQRKQTKPRNQERRIYRRRSCKERNENLIGNQYAASTRQHERYDDE